MRLKIDVGAQRGDFSIGWVSNKDVAILAFEPFEHAYDYIKERTKDFDNYFLYKNAVDVEEGEANFYVANQEFYLNGASSLFPFHEMNVENFWHKRSDEDKKIISLEKVTKVQKVRLDSILDNFQFDFIDYIKIDAQGNDLNVLKSLGKYLPLVLEGQIETFNHKDEVLYQDCEDNLRENVENYLIINNFEIYQRKVYVGETDLIFRRKQ